MKKTFFFTATAVLIISLAGCGSKTEEAPDVTPTITVSPTATETPSPTEAPTATPDADADLNLNLEDVYQALLKYQTDNGKEVPVLFPGTGDPYLEEFYSGLFDLELRQSVYYIAPITGFACEVVLVEVANEADIETVKSIFQARIDAGAADTGYPETAKLWQTNSHIQSTGNYVGMIVFPDEQIVPDNVFTDLSK